MKLSKVRDQGCSFGILAGLDWKFKMFGAESKGHFCTVNSFAIDSENILKSTTGENDAFSVQNLRLIPDDDEEHEHAVELRLRDRGGAVMA
ncbi:hypothetical protein F2Q69_00011816 [Brassica cretica]|uniref:Uncharacterized protein n=1 Tax=Brassica cretica TaxID=69181 RepID=A0A8S9QTQ6_BRACR|nr:hypothetical protein F2Q69_00011816 [Brassica cretica]